MGMKRSFINAFLRARSAWRTWGSKNPPPSSIPVEMREAFTLGGRIPVLSWYLNDVVAGSLLWTTRSPSWSPSKVRRKVERYYGSTDRFLYDALEKYPIADQDVVIIGSEMPWYECICATYGAHVTTIEYRQVDCRIPGLFVQTPDEFARNPRRFDVVVSISSVEHDGLGRYGDPLRPEGDFAAMRSFRDLLKPGGLLLLAVPVGRDALVWNAHRIYGKTRLPMLFDGWEIVDSFGWDETCYEKPLGHFEMQPVFVLRSLSNDTHS